MYELSRSTSGENSLYEKIPRFLTLSVQWIGLPGAKKAFYAWVYHFMIKW